MNKDNLDAPDHLIIQLTKNFTQNHIMEDSDLAEPCLNLLV